MSDLSSQALCIVTGGSLGIGAAICQRFSQQGWQVINIDLLKPHQTDNNIEWRSCDMTDTKQIKAVFASILQDYGRVDALISNAGIHYSGTIEQTSDEDFDKVFNLNVKGAITATRAVLPLMKTQCKGVILYMASDQALIAKRNSFAYNLSKMALASLAKTTALDYASYQIRANAICPGTIETPLYHQAIDRYVTKSGADKQQVHAEEAALQPLGRLGQADEVAALAYFLASDEASFITGSLQVIDGGYTTQ
ncbi:SDR family NAD(P)-dependent oxidoreductase [Paraglaciecola hydrolytica]|uniref:Oxidoreductase n=1 Tax=Paraglaciecola hydrolytica TaxID=1799789 RepID=A0A148KMV2_9ALTE|nr:SDR family oxidoreductase [Paraglaciecola hydrolytica]KXI27653.1 oxidoreductase [Paraglaciecola hydrolytica]